uniref:SGNH hydrolase-type esterase domain-containing protein n=1 Tax=Haptolina brevifila TaxID=156173 RepID=A0A7S2CNW0_9EUKA
MIEVGGNDLFGGSTQPPREAVVSAYVELLQLVRSLRPSPCLLLAVVCRLDTPMYEAGMAVHPYLPPEGSSPSTLQPSTSPHDLVYECTEAAVARYMEKSGDQHVRVISAPDAQMRWPDDGGGVEHWGASGQRKFAEGLRQAIEELPSELTAPFFSQPHSSALQNK